MRLLFVIAFIQVAYGGNVGVRTSNLLSPAGVTYVDGAYHAGLAAGPVTYSASIAQPVYQSAAVSAAPAIAVASQPVAVAAAPLAYAAPTSKYAAVPTVQHVPGVADVPVTRIDAQPAVIQKTVDVVRPAVKTQRYEVRRPAIQKQFYDIEERVVVKPAGSAVVELDEPLSKTQKGPSVIQPTGEAVAVSSSSAVAVPTAPAVETVPSFPTTSGVSSAQAELPSVEINLARSSLPAPAGLPYVGISRNSISAPAPAAIPSVGVARTSYAAAAPASVPSVEVRTSLPAAAPAPLPSVGIARTAFAAPAPAPFPSVEVRNSFSAPAPIQPISYSAPLATQSVGISTVPIKTLSISAPVQTTTITGVSPISSGVSGISAVSGGPTEVPFPTPAPQYQQQIAQSTSAPQVSDDSVSIESADFSLARSSGLARSYPRLQTLATPSAIPSQETIFRSELPSKFSGQSTVSARGSLIVNYPNPLDLIPQSRFRSAPVYSEESSRSEINHDNQQKLIQLLTARGQVSEIGFGRSGSASYPVEAGQVRARVLSATPAPAYAAPTGERVNTRRVVVSRPIETLQEVEVAEPVTKFERVRVNQAAVVKTASQDVVRVPTSVPVYGKTLAPIAEAPVAAYSADWQ